MQKHGKADHLTLVSIRRLLLRIIAVEGVCVWIAESDCRIAVFGRTSQIMAKFPALPLWTDALIGDTYHLSPAQFGAYLRLLICAWRRPNCDLPNDDVFLGRAIGDPKNWHRLKGVVLAFFTLGEDNLWRQNRLLDERNYCARKAASSSAAGRASALKRLNRDAKSLPSRYNAEATPTPIPTEEEEKDLLRKSKKTEKGALSKGTRWPPGQCVPESWVHAAAARRAELGLPQIDLAVPAETFANYWPSKTGTQATKLDWQRTWLNWAIRAETPRNGTQHVQRSTPHEQFALGALLAARDIDDADKG